MQLSVRKPKANSFRRVRTFNKGEIYKREKKVGALTRGEMGKMLRS